MSNINNDNDNKELLELSSNTEDDYISNENDDKKDNKNDAFYYLSKD